MSAYRLASRYLSARPTIVPLTLKGSGQILTKSSSNWPSWPHWKSLAAIESAIREGRRIEIRKETDGRIIAYITEKKTKDLGFPLGRLRLTMADAKAAAYAKFNGVFPQLQAQILDHARKTNLPQEMLDWLEKNLQVNATGGKCNRGMSVPDSVALLLGRDLSEDEYFKTAALGWMIELLQAFFLVSDDIMDSSITRRGKPCWYREEGVGMIAINDAFMLESAIYLLLKQFFKTHPAYADMMELFHEVTWQTELGQLCDLLTAPEDKVNLHNFNEKKHSFIVIYKTAYYSFYLPVALALHYQNIATPENLKAAEGILIPMGEYFQVQDDYLDNFGDPAHIGKIGTDIMDNKCSWLVCQALKLATPEQRKILDDHYGRKNADDEAKIKALYNEMRLEQKYLDYEEARVTEIKGMIARVNEASGLKKSVFESFLNKIYKRSK